MATNPVARLGDTGTHGGSIITAAANSYADGARIARIGDLYNCPIHGINAIMTGAPDSYCEGARIARSTSVTECGSIIIGGATNVLSN